MPQASSMSDTRGMLQAAPHHIELLIKKEANQNRNKKRHNIWRARKANFLTQNFSEAKF
jgi:hypothetical protein